MSAVETALAVLRWAAAPEGPPPSGDLGQLERLLQPGEPLRRALAATTAIALARLGLNDGADTGAPLGPGSLLLAASVGGALHPAAGELLRLCDPPRTGPAPALHHALVGPAIGYLPAALVEELLLHSPLTALLSLPPRGGEDAAITLCETLVATAVGRRLLAHRFADPEVEPPQLRWRARLLDALRLESRFQPFVLDVFEAAVALHAPGWMKRNREAARILSAPAPGEQLLQRALATGEWWEPFLALYRADHEAVRERRYLNDFELYLGGIRLAQTTIRLREGLH